MLSDCLKCSVVTWCCSAPGKRKVAAQYKHLNGCDPGGGDRDELWVKRLRDKGRGREEQRGTRSKADPGSVGPNPREPQLQEPGFRLNGLCGSPLFTQRQEWCCQHRMPSILGSTF